MPKGHLLTITLADVEPLWLNPRLRLEDIAQELGCGRAALAKYAQEWGLPKRPRPRWQNRVCDACRHRGWCGWAEPRGYRFPCMPRGEWDTDEMQMRCDGDRVGASNFGVAGRVRLGGVE